MDPMSQFEADRKLKEEQEIMELADTVVLDDYYLSSRDLVGKGREVHPTGRQRLDVQNVSEKLRFAQPANRRKSTGTFSNDKEDDDSAAYFDLNAKPRILITHGPINKLEPDSILRKFSKRHLFIFSDVMIICSLGKKEGIDIFDVQHVLWAQDLRVKHLSVLSISDAASGGGMMGRATAASPTSASPPAGSSDPSVYQCGFELITAKTRKRAQSSLILTAEDEVARNNWLADIEAMLLAYHRETELSNQLGWFHEVIQGTFHSAAYLGDSVLLRRHLRTLTLRAHSNSGAGIDAVDESGMTALHWAVLRDHEICTRILLDRGADVDALQKGLNTPLLLAALAPTNSEILVRLLIDRGADITTRNLKDHDVVFMAVLYGHASKGLPWLLQLLNAKGLDLNAPDGAGATPLHLCAKKNLSRPIRMLVDSGADVNGKHGTTQLTPLQMACGHNEPDVETIRSFLDKGAYPNWRDLQGRTAFDIVLHSQQQKSNAAASAAENNNNTGGLYGNSLSQSVLLSDPKASLYTGSSNVDDADTTEDYGDGESSDGASYDGEDMLSNSSPAKKSNASRSAGANAPAFKGFSSKRPLSSKFNSSTNNMSTGSMLTSGGAAAGTPTNGQKGQPQQKWRAMETTIRAVGDWAVKALPALLEISKRGGRCRPQQETLLLSLRPSFRAAVDEAQGVWRKGKMPNNFLEFVLVREHSGEDLRLHKTNWTKDSNSPMCQLCCENFNIRVRRHHCRSCGVLCCDDCSSKRLVLSALTMSESEIQAVNSGAITATSTKETAAGADGKESNGLERVCDGCFNRLLHEAAQPSPDHFRVKQLKRCALDVIQSLEDLVDALDDPEGDPNSYQASLRETAGLARNLDAIMIGGPSPTSNHKGGDTGSAAGDVAPKSRSAFSFKFSSKSSSSNKAETEKRLSAGGGAKHAGPQPSPSRKSAKEVAAGSSSNGSTEALLTALKLRDAKLQRAQDIVAKFLEASEGYQKVSKKLVEQKQASNRLWGATDNLD
eukprot:gene13468-15505_t